MRERMKKAHNIVIIALFFLFLGGFGLAGILLPDKDMSRSERRALASFPEYTKEEGFAGFMGEMDGYLADQFPLRELFRHVKAGFASFILMQTDVNGYSLKGGSEFEQLYPTNVEYHAQNAKVFADIAKKHYSDSKVYYSIVYDKGYYAKKGLGLDYDALIGLYRSAMPDRAAYVDLSDALSPDDFYRTDIHWRQDRLDRVLDRLSAAIGFEKFTPGELSPIAAGSFYGVLYGQAALPVKADPMVYLSGDILTGCTVRALDDQALWQDVPLYDTDAFVSGEDAYDLFLGGESPVIEITNPAAASSRTLVIYRDSFARSLAPLMVKSYQKIVLIDLRWVNRAMYDPIIGTFALGDGRTDVLFLSSAQVLNANRFGL